MGARTDAARAEVVARRQLLLDEVTALEAAGRSAVDIPAKMRRAPAKTAALAAGTAFLVLGGPKRVYRAVRRKMFGPTADLPKSMLPKQVDKTLKALGDDGEKVRGTLEHEFAAYLEQTRPRREARDTRGTLTELGANILRPVTYEGGKRLARALLSPESGSFASATERIRARRSGRGSEPGKEGEQAGASESGPAPSAAKPRPWERRPTRRNILRP